jgi:hypothetical protein
MWHADLGPDHIAATAFVPNGSGEMIRGIARCDNPLDVYSAIGDYYGVTLKQDGSQAEIYKAIGTSDPPGATFTLIDIATSGIPALGSLAVLRWSVIGTALELWVNDTLVCSGTDSDITVGGYIGVAPEAEGIFADFRGEVA